MSQQKVRKTRKVHEPVPPRLGQGKGEVVTQGGKVTGKEVGGASRRDPGFEGWLPSSSAAHGSSQTQAREVSLEGSRVRGKRPSFSKNKPGMDHRVLCSFLSWELLRL